MLSKKKKFYTVYWGNGTVNIEKHSVVYANKKYVYYKSNDDDKLGFIRTDYIYDRPVTGMRGLVDVDNWSGRMKTFNCWNIEDADRDTILEIISIKVKEGLNSDIDGLECKYEELINKSKLIKKKIEALKKEKGE